MDEDIFTKLISFGADIENHAVTVAIARDDMQGFRVKISTPLAALLIASLASAAGSVNATLPEDERIAIPLRASSVFLSQSLDGLPMIVFELEGGTPLALELAAGDLAALAAEMALLARPADGRAN